MRVTSGRRSGAAFALLTSILVTLLASSSAPTPLYATYQERWGFSPVTVTVVFGVYAVAVLVSLLVLGGLSDHIGRRPVLTAALIAQAGVMLLFATASGLDVLLLARILQGLATGAAVAAIGAALVDLHPGRGPVANAAGAMGGTASGALVSALLVQLLPAPTRLVYFVLLALFLLQTAGVRVIAETSRRVPGAMRSLRPTLALPGPVRGAIAVAAPSLIAVWALAGLLCLARPIPCRPRRRLELHHPRRHRVVRPGRQRRAHGPRLPPDRRADVRARRHRPHHRRRRARPCRGADPLARPVLRRHRDCRGRLRRRVPGWAADDRAARRTGPACRRDRRRLRNQLPGAWDCPRSAPASSSSTAPSPIPPCCSASRSSPWPPVQPPPSSSAAVAPTGATPHRQRSAALPPGSHRPHPQEKTHYDHAKHQARHRASLAARASAGGSRRAVLRRGHPVGRDRPRDRAGRRRQGFALQHLRQQGGTRHRLPRRAPRANPRTAAGGGRRGRSGGRSGTYPRCLRCAGAHLPRSELPRLRICRRRRRSAPRRADR